MTGRVRSSLRALFGRRALEREMQDEMAEHLRRATERFMRAGMSLADAKGAARREFGVMGALQEDARDARGGRSLEDALRDVRFAFRHIRRYPLTSAIIVFVLGVGIGANTTLSSLGRGLVTRPAPGVARPDRLFRAQPQVLSSLGLPIEETLSAEGTPIRARNFSKIEAALDSRLPEVEEIAVSTIDDNAMMDVGDGGDAVAIHAVSVSPNYFAIAGVGLALGQGWATTSYDGRPTASIIIDNEFWVSRFYKRPDVIGRAVRINGERWTVGGVAPREFRRIDRGPVSADVARPTVWVPNAIAATTDSAALDFIVRIRGGTTPQQATTSMTKVAQTTSGSLAATGLVALTPARNDIWGDVATFANDGTEGELAALFLLLCILTVSALQAGLGVARRDEIRTRLAMGASRHRVIRQLFTETLVISIGGGAVGLACAALALRIAASHFPNVDISLDWHSAGFTLLMTAAVAVLCGVSPTLHAMRSVRPDRHGPRVMRSRMQRGLVVAQVAVSLPIIAGYCGITWLAVAAIRDQREQALDAHLVRVQFARGRYSESQNASFDSLTREMAAMSGVVGVVPQQSGAMSPTVLLTPVGGQPTRSISARVTGAAPGLMRLLDIQLVGRDFVSADARHVPTPTGGVHNDQQMTVLPGADTGGARPLPLMIGRRAAVALWGTTDVIGRRARAAIVRFGWSSRDLHFPSTPLPGEYIVTAVYDDTHMPDPAVTAGFLMGDNDIEDDRRPAVPASFQVFAPFGMTDYQLLVRTSQPASAMVAPLRRIAAANSARVGITSAATMTDLLHERMTLYHRALIWSIAEGCGLLVFGSIGLFAIVSFMVDQRKREIGVRVALGASPLRVIGMFFGDGLRFATLGILCGLVLSAAVNWIAARSHTWLWGAPSAASCAAAVGVVLVVASIASWLPARRAAGIDPIRTLRVE